MTAESSEKSETSSTNPSAKHLAEALVAFQSKVPTIAKTQTAKIPTKTGGSYSYKYADLADIWEAIRKPLADNGLAVTQFLVSDETSDYILTRVQHTSGECESGKFRIPTGGKTPQEVGSVITYYKRYALGAALGISTEEDDDGQAGNSKPEQYSTRTKVAAPVERTASPDRKASDKQVALIHTLYKRAHPQSDSTEEYKLYLTMTVERDLQSSKDLTSAEASKVIETLQEELGNV